MMARLKVRLGGVAVLVAVAHLGLACADNAAPGGAEPPEPGPSATAAVPQPLTKLSVTLNTVPIQHLQAVQRGLGQRLDRSGTGLSFQRGAKGAMRVDLRGRYQHVLIANKDSEGHSHISCVDSPEGVAAALGHPGAPP